MSNNSFNPSLLDGIKDKVKVKLNESDSDSDDDYDDY